MVRAKLLSFLGLIFYSSRVWGSCGIGKNNAASSTDSENYFPHCAEAIRDHVVLEFRASLQYMLMGAYFEQDSVNLPGFSKMFFGHADEERQHGIRFMDYLRLRGFTEDDIFDTGFGPVLSKTAWADGEEALRDALSMEKLVSKQIKLLVDTCDSDGVKDYHAADWLTGTWLEEQLKGQREIAGMINTLSTFRKDHESLADWMFSQHLMK